MTGMTRTECTLPKFVDDTEQGGAGRTSEDRIRIKNVLGKLEKCFEISKMKFSKDNP